MSIEAKSRHHDNLDQAEIDRFQAMAAEWWDPNGPFRPLHAVAPVRLHFIRDHLVRHFRRDARSPRPLAELDIVDIGCGGGLTAEPLARLGAHVTGLDPGADIIEAARRHADGQGLAVTYQAGRAEDLADAGRLFDAVLALEVVEHVPDLARFVAACAALVRPGGMMLLSTLNRTVKSYLMAIVGAEYVLRWLPAGTHHWDRFVTPDELDDALTAAGLTPIDRRGMVYQPLHGTWRLSADTDVNYLAAAVKRE